MNIYTLRQRRAAKIIAIKRLKQFGLDIAIKRIEGLMKRFPKNEEYYKALIKGLIKLDKKLNNKIIKIKE